MFHTEKTHLPLVYSIFIVMKEVGDKRAYKVQPEAQYELYLCNGGSYVPNIIIEMCIGFI